MNVKKIITLLLAFALTLSLAACGSKDDGKGDSDTQGATADSGERSIRWERPRKNESVDADGSRPAGGALAPCNYSNGNSDDGKQSRATPPGASNCAKQCHPNSQHPHAVQDCPCDATRNHR